MKKTGSRLGKVIAAVLAVAALLAAFVMDCSVAHAGGRLSGEVSSGTVTAEVVSVDDGTIELRVLPTGSGSMMGDAAGEAAGPGGSVAPGAPDGADASGGADVPSSPDGAAPPDAPGSGTSGGTGAPGAPDGAGAPSAGTSSSGAPGAPGASGGGQPPMQADGADGGPHGNSASGESGQDGSTLFLTVREPGIITYADGEHAGESAPLSAISEGTILELEVSGGTEVSGIAIRSSHDGQGGTGGPGGAGQAPDSNGGGASGSGASGSTDNGTGANVFSEQVTEEGGTYTSTAADENAVRVQDGAEVTLSGATIAKSGDTTSSENSDFHGLNAGTLVLDGSSLVLDGADVSCTGQGANGVFVYGEGSTAVVSNTTINTTQGNSGGIEVAGGGSIVADGLTVDTQGASSAAIRSDRGGGTETVTGGTYTTHGAHSPAIYCTADVTVSDATLVSEGSEGVVIEGKNSVDLQGCSLMGNIDATQTRTGVSPNVMIYQSMSGDATEGTGSFSMSGGTLGGNAGTVFYVTNTDAEIALEGVDIQNTGDDLLIVAGNDGVWGRSGSNGGKAGFLAKGQVLSGAITVDSLSSLSLDLEDGSSYTGAINEDGQGGTVDVVLGDGCSWKLTGDSYVSSLDGDTAGIDLDGHTLYVDGVAW